MDSGIASAKKKDLTKAPFPKMVATAKNVAALNLLKIMHKMTYADKSEDLNRHAYETVIESLMLFLKSNEEEPLISSW